MLGQTSRRAAMTVGTRSLQWRAEQLLGQTRCPARRSARRLRGFNGGPSNCSARHDRRLRHRCEPAASMEGRAIARPDRDFTGCGGWAIEALQWRAEQLLGQTVVHASVKSSVGLLQWRAEQLLGQTGDRPRADPQHLHASMEGRAIARPDRSLDLGWLTCTFAGVCERSRKRELRRCLDSVVKLRFALCHKGSSGP